MKVKCDGERAHKEREREREQIEREQKEREREHKKRERENGREHKDRKRHTALTRIDSISLSALPSTGPGERGKGDLISAIDPGVEGADPIERGEREGERVLAPPWPPPLPAPPRPGLRCVVLIVKWAVRLALGDEELSGE